MCLKNNAAFLLMLVLVFLQAACDSENSTIHKTVLTAIEPSEALPGETIKLTGKNLGETKGQVFVLEVEAEVSAWSTTEIKAIVPDLGAGSYPVYLRIGTWTSNALLLAVKSKGQNDTVEPTTKLSSTPPILTNQSIATFTFFGTDDLGVDHFECRLDGEPWQTCTSPRPYSSLLEGSHTFSARAVDGAGNVDSTPPGWSWTIDLTLPDTTITLAPESVTNAMTATFEFDGTDNVAVGQYQCRLDAGAWGTCTSPKYYTSLSAGSHIFEVRAADMVGNIDLTPATASWTVDTTPPDASLDTTPPSVTNATTASFTFSGTDNIALSRYECRLNAGAWATCSSPRNYTSLTAGSHTFDVRSIDIASNVDLSPATYSWTVDLTDPTTTMTGGPGSVTNATTAVLGFIGDDDIALDHFECRIDGGIWQTCTSPQPYSSLTIGAHTFDVRAIDSAGNADLRPASWAWTIDQTPPDTTITSAPAAVTNATSASFSFSGTDNIAVASYQCRLDAVAWETCTSPKNYTGLTAGTHTIDVRAVDTAGNMDLTPAMASWIVDTTPPDTSLDSTPPSVTNATTASFTFSGTDNIAVSRYECRLNAGAWVTCSSPSNYTSLTTAGSHTFDVRSVDIAGNIDLTPSTFSWTVDLTAPTTTMTGGPGAVTNVTTAVLGFIGDDNIAMDHFECRLDGGLWQTCTSPQPYSSLTTGAHTFNVRAIDSAGNIDPSPASWSWTIDQTPPDTTITSAPAAVTNATSANFSFSGTDNIAVASYQCRLDTGAWETCTSPKNYASLTPGSLTFDVRAVDTAGNLDLTPATASWIVDTTPPDTSLDSTPPSVTNATTASFSFSGTDNIGVSRYECRLNAGAWATCSSPRNYTSLTAGSHTFDVRSVDTAGNIDLTPATYFWTVDLTDPTTTMTGGPGSVTNATTAVLGFIGDDDIALDHFECRLDGSAWQTCTSPQPYSSLPTGAHSFDVRAIDSAGNADLTPASWAWTIDQTPPDTTITSAPAAMTNATSANFSFSGTDNVAVGSYVCRLDAGAWQACSSPKGHTGVTVGTHTFYVRAIDTVGNVDLTPAFWSWTVDLTPPDTTITSTPAAVTNATTVSFTFSGSDNFSVDHYDCSLDSGAWAACTSPKNYTSLPKGGHTFAVRAADTAGNVDPIAATWSWTNQSGPWIDQRYPNNVTIGTSISLVGTDFGAVTGTVFIGGTPTVIEGWSSNTVQVAVGPGTRVGTQSLMLTDSSGQNSNSIPLTILGGNDVWLTEDLPWGRSEATAVWTGKEMVVWGGQDGGGSKLNSGGRYNPSTDSWVNTSTTGAPTGRFSHTAVWTGSQMVVWGGNGGGNLNTGGRYNPSTDSWVSTSTTGAPTGSSFHKAVWTGSQMVVWGNSSGRYDPTTDIWVSISTAGAPTTRQYHTAVWTGSEMVVWGGLIWSFPAFGGMNTGGRYDPGTDTWQSTSTSGAPTSRFGHTAVWTGSRMVVWGGADASGKADTGGRYNPSTDTWESTSTTGAPTARDRHTAVWTGSLMVVWGGINVNTGGRYNPGTDTWESISTTGAPTSRYDHTAVWNGSQMIVWGGIYSASCLNTGGRYNPSTDSWVSTSTAGAPTKRADHTAVWTGNQMVVWGGADVSALGSGGRYNPSTDSWLSTSTTGAPTSRYDHTAVWTGSQMVVWGGYGGGYLITGGRYAPSTDSWSSTATTDAPTGRTSHTAVWTGSQMVVWGGRDSNVSNQNSGGHYNPSTDSWVSTSTTGAPTARYDHTAVWTGSQMVVWGGYDGSYLNTGGRYDPSMDSWYTTATTGAPTARVSHTSVWTGNQMVVWGGRVVGPPYSSNTGGRYDPTTDNWYSTATTGAPTRRYWHTAVWTGSQMVVWGGGIYETNTGGRYDPSSNTWVNTSTAGAPEARYGHTAVWTGSQMVVWGGAFYDNEFAGTTYNSMGRYVP